MSPTLVADTYLVEDAGRVYSVLDVYVRGSHTADSIAGVTGLSTHGVVFATSRAQGVTRDDCGKIASGSVTSDLFVQAGGSSWCPSYCCGTGQRWDSFVGGGVRRQCASVTNRFARVVSTASCSSWIWMTAFSQAMVANASFINNGSTSGWSSSFGSSPYTSAGLNENPFARLSLYWGVSISPLTYPDLSLQDCEGRSLLLMRGRMQSGVACASAAPSFVAGSGPGTTLDAPNSYLWMLGRFTIEVTGMSWRENITMQVQFNMVGKNGSGTNDETGTSFSGALTTGTNAQYKASQFFTFAMPPAPPCPSDLDGNRDVDLGDVALVLLDIGPCAGCPADTDASGVVDLADVAFLLLDFGPCD